VGNKSDVESQTGVSTTRFALWPMFSVDLLHFGSIFVVRFEKIVIHLGRVSTPGRPKPDENEIY
jgi:hypothetical protein